MGVTNYCQINFEVNLSDPASAKRLTV